MGRKTSRPRLQEFAQASHQDGQAALLDTGLLAVLRNISPNRLWKAWAGTPRSLSSCALSSNSTVSQVPGAVRPLPFPNHGKTSVRSRCDLETPLSQMPEEDQPKKLHWGPPLGKKSW